MELNIEKSMRAQKAMELFQQGYNCSQSVFLAFADMYEMDVKTAAMLSSSFGGGMGRLREVCGAVSGMFLVAGILYGYWEPQAREEKTAHYKRIQLLAGEFEDVHHSFICRQLLGLEEGKDSPVPEDRTQAYYKKRPCRELVGTAAAIMEGYIDSVPR